MLLSFTEDDVDGVIGVGDDGLMRMAPLGERGRCGRGGGGVPVNLTGRPTERRFRSAAKAAPPARRARNLISQVRLIGQGC